MADLALINQELSDLRAERADIREGVLVRLAEVLPGDPYSEEIAAWVAAHKEAARALLEDPVRQLVVRRFLQAQAPEARDIS